MRQAWKVTVTLYDQETGLDTRSTTYAIQATDEAAAKRRALQEALAEAGSQVRDCGWRITLAPMGAGRLGAAGWRKPDHRGRIG